MKSILYFVLCACVVWGFAGEARAMDGNGLWDVCRFFADGSERPVGTCLGYVIGVMDSAVLWADQPYCTPRGSTNNQATLVVIKYLKNNPEKLHMEAVEIVLLALLDAFPCAGE